MAGEIVLSEGAEPATPAAGRRVLYATGDGLAEKDDAGAVHPLSLGVPRLYKSQAIAYNAANLRTGITIYTPTSGDYLLDVWFQVDTAFNGTTPKADIAQWTLLANGTGGWFGTLDATLLGSPDTADSAYVGDAFMNGVAQGGRQGLSLLAGTAYAEYRGAPGYFNSTDPLQVIITQDGLKNGAAIGGSAGSLRVLFVIATAMDTPG